MAEYDVGYGKPPLHSRFKKGQSGNPTGGRRHKSHALPEPGGEQMKAGFLAEAYRLIPTLKGDKKTKIPMVQAIIRAVAVTAAKGSSRAQRHFIGTLKEIEEESSKAQLEHDQALLQYKANGEAELERRKELGITGPDLIPHPDDIIYNPNTGQIRVLGPRTRQEANLWEHVEDTLESIALLRGMPPENKKGKGHKKMLATEKKIL